MPLITFTENAQPDINTVNGKKKISDFVYMDDITLFTKNEKKKMETFKQTIRIYSQDTVMEFGIEKCSMLVRKRGKRHMK